MKIFWCLWGWFYKDFEMFNKWNRMRGRRVGKGDFEWGWGSRGNGDIVLMYEIFN